MSRILFPNRTLHFLFCFSCPPGKTYARPYNHTYVECIDKEDGMDDEELEEPPPTEDGKHENLMNIVW